ncbi:hypothetical protein MUK42_27513 [Musa troglodytarum]|uniref:Uncharacterized protein n=1 Tax=Musa troglodytarum TaxID=320322 RepID=A0A9E7KAV8_9LILI|nr:hypothetical protein MUK42_27513 [Musa troglodytarum]
MVLEDTLPFQEKIHPLSTRRVIYWEHTSYLLWLDVDKDVIGYMTLPAINEGVVQTQKLGVTYDDEILTITRLLANGTVTIWMMSKEGGWVRKYKI